MEKSINLALTKSLFGFVSLLEGAIKAVSSEKRPLSHEISLSKFSDIFGEIFRPATSGLLDFVQADYKIGRYVNIGTCNGNKKQSTKKSCNEKSIVDDALSQDEIDALLGGVSETPVKSSKFWVGVVWEENGKHDPCI